jgi:peptide/nickel transport system substrate-binding protein
MNDIMIEDVVMIPLVHKAWVSGANAEIEGINLTPWDNELWNVKDWRYR